MIMISIPLKLRQEISFWLTRKAETVIRVTADEGAKVTVEAEDGSPEPDRSSFTCTGSREKDCFTVRISEPGEYSYTLRVGEKEYKVRISGLYEDAGVYEQIRELAADPEVWNSLHELIENLSAF